MEQEQQTPLLTPETGSHKAATETLPSPQKAPEAQPASRERYEIKQPGIDSGGSSVAQSPPAPTAAVQAQTSDDSQVSQIVVDDTPLIAADQDLIESVWVDKAKKIVQETRNDPYLQENRVSQLQADYLKKRYGKDIKLTISD
jgi:hypothetical protein